MQEFLFFLSSVEKEMTLETVLYPLNLWSQQLSSKLAKYQGNESKRTLKPKRKKLINLISRGMYFGIFSCRITNNICTSFWQACVVEELVQKLFVHPPFLNSSHHKNETNLKFSNFKWTPTSFLNYPNLDLVWNSHIDIVKYENFWHNPK